jgi:hypothetical protein
MKMHNGSMQNGYNKFRKTINNNHVFRKAYNTLKEVNNYALPTLTAASAIAPTMAPVFGSVAAGLRASETFTGKIKNRKI